MGAQRGTTQTRVDVKVFVREPPSSPLAPALLSGLRRDGRTESRSMPSHQQMRRKEPHMRIPAILGVLLLTGMTYAVNANAQCELSCAASCRQEAAMCNQVATFTARSDRLACESEAHDASLECEGVALDARSACTGLCSGQFRICMAEAKTALKACTTEVRATFDACKLEVAQVAAGDHAACAADASACVASCSNGNVPQ
jgi:hypothetical protein